MLGAYLDHLDKLEKEDPALLGAYIYTMYMAIFAGGFIIRKMVKVAFSLTGENDDGVMIFSCEDKKRRDAKSKLKNLINNEMNLTNIQEDRFIEETVRLFAMNNQLVSTVQYSPTFSFEYTKWKTRFVAATCMFIGCVVSIYIFFI